jgi:hypothetical protein
MIAATTSFTHAARSHVPITLLKMSQFVVIAELLRETKAAEQRFIALWALDCLMDESRFIEKIAADLGRLEASGSSGDAGWSMN